jgi:hypothetical protein
VTKVEDLIREFIGDGEDFLHSEVVLELARRALDLTNIVDPPAEKYDYCWSFIYGQVCYFDQYKAQYQDTEPHSQKTKDAAHRILSGLRRAQIATKDLPLTEEAFHVEQELLSSKISEVLEWCRRVLEEPVRPSHRTDGELKRVAAKYAFLILHGFGKSTATTKKSLFCKLAAAFYGDSKADLHHQCREVQRQFREDRRKFFRSPLPS